MPLPPQPQPPEEASQFSRIIISDLKSQITKQLGLSQAQRYFGYLNEFLLQKLTKVEFDKFCFKTLGRENLPLHNLLIRSILRNACQAKIPPLVNQENGVPRPSGVSLKKSPQPENAFNSPQTVNPTLQYFSNGDLLPPSPRKIRSGTQNRRIKDRPSPLGPDTKVDIAIHKPYVGGIKENGDLRLYDSKRSSQHPQNVPAEQLAKRPRIENAALHKREFVHNKGVEVVSLEDRDNLEHKFDSNTIKDVVQAPLGIPCFSASIGGARQSSLVTVNSNTDTFSRNYDSGELCDTDALKRRMEKLAEAQGLEGVTLDCANVLNNGLDAYLKQLISSCIDLVGTRKGHEQIKQSVLKPQSCMKPINGVWVDTHIQAQSSSQVPSTPDELKSNVSITMQDFKVAMELKPHQLGEDWPLLIEKISVRSFEE